MVKVKKVVIFILMMSIFMTFISACAETGIVLNPVLRVYNWIDFIDPSVIELFTEETGIEIIYKTYESNEHLYNQIRNMNGYSYDVVFPSDYMVKRMTDENMLAEIDFRNVPNYKNIDEQYKGQPFDKKNLFSVPYIWGTLCLAYNSEKVTDDEVKSWEILWNKKYKNEILMMNSERESIAIVLKLLNYSMNSKKMTELNEAKEKLLEQKPLILTYTLDNVKEKMINEEAAIAVMWSSDVKFVKEKNPKIKFSIPEEGTNIWYDNICILKGSKYKSEAEQFINFLCREDIALMNAMYLSSGTPNSAAFNKFSDEMKNNNLVYISDEMIAKSEVFEDLSDWMKTYSSLWTEVYWAEISDINEETENIESSEMPELME